jgi:hypothetical protein
MERSGAMPLWSLDPKILYRALVNRLSEKHGCSRGEHHRRIAHHEILKRAPGLFERTNARRKGT